MGRLSFKLEAQASGSNARAAQFTTLHGKVQTPVFMPVGTNATVKTQRVEVLKNVGSQVLLANTYHLLLRPGPQVFKSMGGIHRFMNWDKPVLTDSGGFQIFSLPHSRTMSEEAAVFQSYLDGQKIVLTPELSIETQKAIGSDIMMVLDQCVPGTADRELATMAMERTHRWALRSLAARGDSKQSLFAIVQGACFEDLRRQSADFLTQHPFDGFAIGGLAVGESRQEREDATQWVAGLLPKHLPRYLMGVGTPIDLLEAVHRGVDMFDCILPNALAQQGVAYTSAGRLDLKRSVYKFSDQPMDEQCACVACRQYSRAYLHHLIKCREILGWQLVGEHNLTFYHQLMANMRTSILENRFLEFYKNTKPVLEQSDLQNPAVPPKVRVRPQTLELGRYSVEFSEKGFGKIKCQESGETMHSVSEPIVEATRLYVDQACFEARLQELAMGQKADSSKTLVLWDVGLGAAANAMAAVRWYEAWAKKQTQENADAVLPSLKILSFENDLDSLRLAVKNKDAFTYLRHGGPEALLEEGYWKSKAYPLEWILIEGDFLEKATTAESPDVIFFDPFSYKTDGPLWTLGSFSKIAEKCLEKNTVLMTYTNSTAVRAALLGAGFFVAKGVGTGPKSETTVALNSGAVEKPWASTYTLLNRDWLGRWERSDSKIPMGLGLEEYSTLGLEQVIRGHQQWQRAAKTV